MKDSFKMDRMRTFYVKQNSRSIMLRNILIVTAVVLVMVVFTTGRERKSLKLKAGREKNINKYQKERSHQARSACLPTEFSCSWGDCITLEEVCDTHYNCPGGEDELNCPDNCTGPHQFQCEDKQKCVGLIDRCDGEQDCHDYSDEAFCGSYECSSGRFKCSTSHECVNQGYVCDGIKDCEDASDEHNCVNGSCSTSQFKCSDGSRCVPLFLVCEGTSQCYDHSDEIGCSCSSNYFQCPRGTCIPNSYKCDGINDCGDLSDEAGCTILPPTTCRDVLTFEDCFRVNETTHPICLIHDDANKYCRKFCGLCQLNLSAN